MCSGGHLLCEGCASEYEWNEAFCWECEHFKSEDLRKYGKPGRELWLGNIKGDREEVKFHFHPRMRERIKDVIDKNGAVVIFDSVTDASDALKTCRHYPRRFNYKR